MHCLISKPFRRDLCRSPAKQSHIKRHVTEHIIIARCIKTCFSRLLCQSGLVQSKVQTAILNPSHHFSTRRGQIVKSSNKNCAKNHRLEILCDLYLDKKHVPPLMSRFPVMFSRSCSDSKVNSIPIFVELITRIVFEWCKIRNLAFDIDIQYWIKVFMTSAQKHFVSPSITFVRFVRKNEIVC